jgi:hypothetical protein
MRWTGNLVSNEELKYVSAQLFRELEGNILPERHESIWRDNIKTYLEGNILLERHESRWRDNIKTDLEGKDIMV